MFLKVPLKTKRKEIVKPTTVFCSEKRSAFAVKIGERAIDSVLRFSAIFRSLKKLLVRRACNISHVLQTR